MALFSWLNADQNRYLFVAQTFLFAFAALSVACAFSGKLDAKLSGRRGTIVVLALALLALVTARWPTFFVTHYINVDEGEMVANAITVPFDPVAWVGFDGLTSGPLNTYALDASLLFGHMPDFMTTRIVAVLTIFVAIAALYATATACFDRVVARLAILPPLVFWAVSTQDDFVHYSSELLSLALCSVMVALIARSWRRSFSFRSVFWIGIVAGVVPFAKLQAGPLEVAIGVVFAAALLAARPLTIFAKLARIAMFAAGSIVFPIAFLAFVAAGGGLHDFWISYVLSSLAYILFGYEPLSFLTRATEFGTYFDWLFLLTCAGAVSAFANSRAPVRSRAILAMSLVVLAGAIYAVFSPHRGSPHYLLYAVIPIATAAAAALYAIFTLASARKVTGVRRGVIAFAFALCCLGLQGALVRSHYPWIGLDYDAFMIGGPHDELVRDIEKHLNSGDRLAIWGWTPEYYVYTSTLLGTRDSICANQYATLGNPYRGYFRARYVDDFKRRKPAAFLDAGAESWDFSNASDVRDDYKSFPELADVVDRDYVLAETYKRFKLFVRKGHVDHGPS